MKKTITQITKALFLLNLSLFLFSNTLYAQAFNEGFDDVTMLTGWDTINKSSPKGIERWRQGYSPLANQVGYFSAYSGHDSSYISASFNSGSGTATISNWLLTPAASIGNGDSITFYTRSTMVNTSTYPDRLQVRMSSVNSSNVGTSATTVGDFTTLLLDINPTLTTTGYPLVWTQYSLPISGLSSNVTGRFAFRYFVTNGGPSGSNSFMVGIDDVAYTPSVPVDVNSFDKTTLRLRVYPNPTVNMLSLDMGTSLSSDASVTIMNELGQVVSEGIMNQGTKKHVLDVSDFATGNYSVTIVDKESNVFHGKFLKN